MSVTTSSPEPIARYNRTAIILHWVVASFIIVAVFVGLAGANIEDKSEAQRLIDLHKSVGLTILGLAILRILWRVAHRPPALPRIYSRLERTCARLVHALLYFVMLALPVTGYIHDSAWKLAASHPIMLYGLIHFPRIGSIQALPPPIREFVHDTFGTAHVYSGYALYVLLVLHLLGVAKHHIFDHEDELQRMLPATYHPDPTD